MAGQKDKFGKDTKRSRSVTSKACVCEATLSQGLRPEKLRCSFASRTTMLQQVGRAVLLRGRFEDTQLSTFLEHLPPQLQVLRALARMSDVAPRLKFRSKHV